MARRGRGERCERLTSRETLGSEAGSDLSGVRRDNNENDQLELNNEFAEEISRIRRSHKLAILNDHPNIYV